MRKFSLAALVLLAFSAIPALAATVVTDYSVGPASSIVTGTAVNVATWAQAATDQSIDIAGEALQSITFEIFARSYTTSGTITNNDLQDNHISYRALGSLFFFRSGVFSVNADGSATFFNALLSHPDNLYSPNGSPGDTKTIPVTELFGAPAPGETTTLTSASTGWSDFAVGLGTKAVNVESTAGSLVFADTNDLAAILASSVSGTLRVTYQSEIPSGIPEPATSVLAGGALLLLGVVGRRFGHR